MTMMRTAALLLLVGCSSAGVGGSDQTAGADAGESEDATSAMSDATSATGDATRLGDAAGGPARDAGHDEDAIPGEQGEDAGGLPDTGGYVPFDAAGFDAGPLFCVPDCNLCSCAMECPTGWVLPIGPDSGVPGTTCYVCSAQPFLDAGITDVCCTTLPCP